MDVVEPVTFENARGEHLAGVVHRPGGWSPGGPAAVVCHGMLSSKDSRKHTEVARRLASGGLLALRFDFAGRGESEGSFEDMTVTGEVEDLAAAASWVRDGGAGPVSLVGSSLGGAVAVVYTGLAGGIACLATLASVSRPGEVLRALLEPDQIDRWRETGVLELEDGRLGWGYMRDAERCDPIAAARRIAVPALFVHGTGDDVVPPASSRDLDAATAGPSRVVLIEGADHAFEEEEHRRRAVDLVVDWLLEHGRGAVGNM